MNEALVFEMKKKTLSIISSLFLIAFSIILKIKKFEKNLKTN